MKPIYLTLISNLVMLTITYGQDAKTPDPATKDIYALIDKYTQSRDNKDTTLLSYILTDEVDQLVSSGEWRYGKRESLDGMMQSSASNPGDRTITVESIRFMNAECAIADARYEIKNADGSSRKMWSTFIVVYEDDRWKISAIRNMLPTGG